MTKWKILNNPNNMCNSCPYEKDNIEYKRQLLGEFNYKPEYCWCNKVGGIHYVFGWCTDKEDPIKITKSVKRKKYNKYERKLIQKHKDQRLKRIINNYGYKPRIGFVDWGFKNDGWQEVGDHIKYPRNSNRQKWIKKETSHKLRHIKDIPLHNGYRRYIDYWWIMD